MIFDFQDVRSTLTMFNKIKERLSDLYSNLSERKAAYITTTDKYDYTDLKIKERKRDEIINTIKRMIVDYESKSEEAKLELKKENIFSNLADKYINDLGNIIKEINNFKYNVYDVEPSSEKGKHIFIKKEYSYVDTIQQQDEFSIESNVHKQKLENKIEA